MGKPANTNQTRSTTDAKRVATQVVLSIHIPIRAICGALKSTHIPVMPFLLHSSSFTSLVVPFLMHSKTKSKLNQKEMSRPSLFIIDQIKLTAT